MGEFCWRCRSFSSTSRRILENKSQSRAHCRLTQTSDCSDKLIRALHSTAQHMSVPATRSSSRRRPADRCKFPGKCHVPDTSESTCQGSRQADKYTEKCHVPDTSDHAFSPRLVPLRVAVSVRRKHRIVAEETVTE